MGELIIVTLLAGGILEMIRFNGGIDWIILKAYFSCKNRQEAPNFSIALAWLGLPTYVPQTIQIALISGWTNKLKDIATNFNIPAKRSASILDIFLVLYRELYLMASIADGIRTSYDISH